MRRAMTAAALAAVCALAACSSSARSTGRTRATTPITAPRPVPSRVVARSVWPGAGAFVGPERLLAAGGIDVGFRQFGRGPDLVLLEGEEMTMTEWPLDLLRDLASHWRVTMFDWRGVDRTSDNAHTPYTIEQLADDTAAFIDADRLQRPLVYGLSTGGEVGLALAVRRPAAVGKLAVSGATTGGRATVPTPPAIQAQFLNPNTNAMTLLGFLFPPGDTRDRDAYLKDLLQVPQTLASPTVTNRQNAAEAAFAAGAGLATGLRALRTPVLVMNGTEDQLVPVANARVIARMIPASRLVVFDNAGHLLIFQDRARFVAVLQSFFGN